MKTIYLLLTCSITYSCLTQEKKDIKTRILEWAERHCEQQRVKFQKTHNKNLEQLMHEAYDILNIKQEERVPIEVEPYDYTLDINDSRLRADPYFESYTFGARRLLMLHEVSHIKNGDTKKIFFLKKYMKNQREI